MDVRRQGRLQISRRAHIRTDVEKARARIVDRHRTSPSPPAVGLLILEHSRSPVLAAPAIPPLAIGRKLQIQVQKLIESGPLVVGEFVAVDESTTPVKRESRLKIPAAAGFQAEAFHPLELGRVDNV